MPSGYREPAPEPPDPATTERWQRSMDEAKARQAARRVRRAGTLALLALLLAGMLGGWVAASRVRGGDSPLSGLGDALERIAVGLLVGLVAGLVARKVIVAHAVALKAPT